ncbi:hypothetical protein GC173_10925 [bacterium]|nr:hypothetical protein [bacterium]
MIKNLLTGSLARKAGLMAAACVLGMGLVGCGGRLASREMMKAPVVPPPGVLVTMYKAPLDFNFGKEGGTKAENSRFGQSETHYIGIWFIRIAWGDGSLDTASKQGGISNLSYADYEYLNILGVYQNVKFNAYGE